MSNDPNIIKIIVEDREGERHELDGPTDMNMNMMELCKSYELPVEGTCGGMAMCASCHMYVTSDHELPERSDDERICWTRHLMLKTTAALGAKSNFAMK